jgi:hypothetical protein
MPPAPGCADDDYRWRFEQLQEISSFFNSLAWHVRLCRLFGFILPGTRRHACDRLTPARMRTAPAYVKMETLAKRMPYIYLYPAIPYTLPN